MTQAATAWAAVVFPVRLGSRRFLAFKFSCHGSDGGSINERSVKALLPGRGDLLLLTRVGSWLLADALLALARCPMNEPVDQAKAASPTSADFSENTARGINHGRQRQTKV